MVKVASAGRHEASLGDEVPDRLEKWAQVRAVFLMIPDSPTAILILRTPADNVR